MTQMDASMLLAAARSLLAMIGPAVTGMLMAFLIVTYLLLDANGLRPPARRQQRLSQNGHGPRNQLNPASCM